MKPYEPSPVPLWAMNLVGFCMVITGSLFLIQTYADDLIASRTAIRMAAIKTLPLPERLVVNPFKDISLDAKAAVVYDVSRERFIYALNEESQLPLASITKLMTAIVSSETLPSFTVVPIVKRDIEYDPKLKVGERWTLSELLQYTLITSSNTGADSVALATASFLEGQGTEDISDTVPNRFVASMNAKASELGLTQTYFLNGSGLDTYKNVGGGYGSAKDVALLTAYMLEKHDDLFEVTREETMAFKAPDGRTVEAKNTNATVASVPGLLGSKTGLTDLAGGNLSIAFDASFGEPFIITILGSTQEGRFQDMQKLLVATIDYLGSAILTEETMTSPETR
ncbi:MAG TPA: hypothetical protein VJH94_00930 [Candidatus Paceibacterota bacterium]